MKEDPLTIVCASAVSIVGFFLVLIVILRRRDPLRSRCYPLLIIEAIGILVYLVAVIVQKKLKNPPILFETWIIYLALISNCSIKLVQVFRFYILIEKEKRKWIAVFEEMDPDDRMVKESRAQWQTETIRDSKIDRFSTFLISKGADSTKFLVLLTLSMISIEFLFPVIATIVYFASSGDVRHLEWIFGTVLVVFSIIGLFYFAWKFRRSQDGYGIKKEFIRGVVFFGLYLLIIMVVYIIISVGKIENSQWQDYTGPIFFTLLFLVTVGYTVMETLFAAIGFDSTINDSTSTSITTALDTLNNGEFHSNDSEKTVRRNVLLMNILSNEEYENSFSYYLATLFQSQLLLLYTEIIQYETGIDRQGYDHNKSKEELNLFRATKVYRMARYFDPKDNLFCDCVQEYSGFIAELARSPDLSVDERIVATLFSHQKQIIGEMLDVALLLFQKTELFDNLLRKTSDLLFTKFVVSQRE